MGYKFFLVRSIGSAATDYSGSIFPRNGLFICLSDDLNARPPYFVKHLHHCRRSAPNRDALDPCRSVLMACVPRSTRWMIPDFDRMGPDRDCTRSSAYGEFEGEITVELTFYLLE